ncbi:hypothetical protein BYT27DRAFT_7254466 [Phlegmacium glaucopus]|nr:hypothetical protein BYT27DRAFT_7254466 [Phlegmacium glaucopus]
MPLSRAYASLDILKIETPTLLLRESSPLAPGQSYYPGKLPLHSKPKLNLYRKTLVSYLKKTAQGREFLRQIKQRRTMTQVMWNRNNLTMKIQPIYLDFSASIAAAKHQLLPPSMQFLAISRPQYLPPRTCSHDSQPGIVCIIRFSMYHLYLFRALSITIGAAKHQHPPPSKQFLAISRPRYLLPRTCSHDSQLGIVCIVCFSMYHLYLFRASSITIGAAKHQHPPPSMQFLAISRPRYLLPRTCSHDSQPGIVCIVCFSMYHLYLFRSGKAPASTAINAVPGYFEAAISSA